MSKNFELALKMDKLQLKRLSFHPNDYDGFREVVDEELKLLAEDPEVTLKYIHENCGEEILYHFTEIIEDLCEAINDRRLIDALYNRADVLHRDFCDNIKQYGEPLIKD